MKDTAQYEEILGLKQPWHVTEIDLSMESQEVIVHVKAGLLRPIGWNL